MYSFYGLFIFNREISQMIPKVHYSQYTWSIDWHIISIVNMEFTANRKVNRVNIQNKCLIRYQYMYICFEFDQFLYSI